MPLSFSIFSPSEWGKLHPILQGTTFYRGWVLGGGAVVLLWTLHNLHGLGWGAQPLYMMCLFTFLFYTGEHICSRCIHYDTWHCGGLGKGAAVLFERRDTPAVHSVRHQHFILMSITAGATLLGLFSGGLVPGTLGIVWIAGASIAIFPKNRQFSWIVGRRKAAEQIAEERSRSEAEPSSSTPLEEPTDTAPIITDGSCPNCGTNVDPEIRFCYECGQEILHKPSQSSETSPVVTEPQKETEVEQEQELEDGITMIPVTEDPLPIYEDNAPTSLEIPANLTKAKPTDED